VTLEVTLTPTFTFTRTQSGRITTLVVLVVVPVPQEEVFTSVLTESCRDSSLRGHSAASAPLRSNGLRMGRAGERDAMYSNCTRPSE
jgi:hypothetical protein